MRLRNADRSVYLDTPDRTKIPKRDDLLEKNSLEMLPKQANLLIIGNGPYAPNQFEIVFVRSPPGQDIFDAHDQIDPSQEHGFLPALKSSDTHRSNNALYNQGVFLYNVDRGENGDDVVALCDDGWGREITDRYAPGTYPLSYCSPSLYSPIIANVIMMIVLTEPPTRCLSLIIYSYTLTIHLYHPLQ